MNDIFKQVKTPVLITVSVVLSLIVVTKIFGPIPFSVTSTVTSNADLFTVEGTGEATGTPDKASFVVGVTKTASTVEQAQNDTNKAVNAIISSLKKLGISDKDIKSTDYNVNPNIDYSDGKQSTTGYTVSTNITVTLKDANKANQALDTATGSGANVITGVNFTLNDDEKEKLEDKARMTAIKNAKAKAQKIAGQAGIKLGKIVSISFGQNTPGPIMYDKMTAQNAQDRISEPTQLQPGENKVSITVYLSYETL
ncbi:MAG: SIMPL domain-containing protein [Candidatus Levybacteria bacterium]|nr:SIMPL domain-containing protein [Candidatus Levybacteria bacterium]